MTADVEGEAAAGVETGAGVEAEAEGVGGCGAFLADGLRFGCLGLGGAFGFGDLGV